MQVPSHMKVTCEDEMRGREDGMGRGGECG